MCVMLLITTIRTICLHDNNFSRRDVLIQTIKNAEKQARYEERLSFLCECRRSKVYPKFNQSLVSSSTRVFRPTATLTRRLNTYKKEMLNEAIQDTSRTLAFLQREQRRLAAARGDQQHPLTSWTEAMANRIYGAKKAELKQHLCRKLSRLAEPGHQWQDGHPSPCHGLREDGSAGEVEPEGERAQLTLATAREQEVWHDATDRLEPTSPVTVGPPPTSITEEEQLTLTTASEQEVWHDSKDSYFSYSSCLSEHRKDDKTSSLPSSPGTGSAAKVDKLLLMTNEEIDPCLTSLLDKGPKFAMTQKITKRTFTDVEVGFERAAYALRWKLDIEGRRVNPPHKSHQLRSRFADNDAAVPRLASLETERTMGKLKNKLLGIYRNHRTNRVNVESNQEQAIKDLSQKENVIVKPSDKCKGFVIMDKDTYVEKALNILGEYEQVQSNPTPKVEAATKRVIKSVMNDKVDKHLMQTLLPQGSRTAE